MYVDNKTFIVPLEMSFPTEDSDSSRESPRLSQTIKLSPVSQPFKQSPRYPDKSPGSSNMSLTCIAEKQHSTPKRVPLQSTRLDDLFATSNRSKSSGSSLDLTNISNHFAQEEVLQSYFTNITF